MILTRFSICLVLALATYVGSTGRTAAQDETAADLPVVEISWGMEHRGYRSGLWTERDTHQVNSGFIVYYYLQVPDGARKPIVGRLNRNLRMTGAGRLEARFFYPLLEAVPGKTNTYRLPMAYMSSSRVGASQVLCLYTFTTDIGDITLTTSPLNLQFVTRSEVDSDPPYLPRPLAISLTKERINMIPIPRVHYRAITLDRFRSDLAELHKLYDPYNLAINLVWAPANMPSDQNISLEVNNTTLEQLIQEIAIQTNLHYTIDTNALIIHADPHTVDNVEIVEDGEPHLRTQDRLRTMHMSTFTVSRKTVGELISSLGGISRQNDPNREGAVFTHVLSDEALNQKIGLELTDVSIYEAVRYFALTAGIRYRLTETGVVFVD